MRLFYRGDFSRKLKERAAALRTKKFPVRFRADRRGKYTGKRFFAMKNQNAEIGISGSSSDFSIDLIST